ncbi:MAG: hypothetical protein ACTHWA_08955 [Arachnia sp.]
MTTSSHDTTDRRIVVVGLNADPGLPADVAKALVERLPARLSRDVDDAVDWQVEVTSETLHLDPGNQLTLLSGEAFLQDRGWDMVVGLTELPQRSGSRPVVLEIDTDSPTAWVSVPALGAIRVRSRTEAVVVALVNRMARRSHGEVSEALKDPNLFRPLAPLPNTSGQEGRVQAGSMRGWGSRMRLLLGMVRVNRPWQLVGSLDTVFAAAAATSAFGVFYASVWNMADTLSPLRLALINAVAIATLVWWLIFHNGLWERPYARGGESTQPRLYNATTVLTVLVGVACMYALLFAATLLASLTVITREYLETTLQHPVDLKDFIQIAWFASSMGTVAGALGSNFESESAVRHAAYGRRQRERLG